MKNRSIKFKITLWYTVFMAILVLLALILLLEAGNTRILSGAETRLKNTVSRAFRDVEYKETQLDFDDDFTITGLEKGIYLSVYDSAGNYLYGRLPSYYNGPDSLLADQLQEEYDFYTHWYTYDLPGTIEGFGDIWIRGIASRTETDRMVVTLIRLSVVIFPLFVLCIIAGGYSITRRVLLPLDRVTETALTISRGNDLQKRIQLPPGQDEVHRLAHTFDYMMDRLQDAFETEKQFTSDVSHELRTPTSVILAQCEYTLSDDISPEETREGLLVIQNQADKISRLISQLLTLARADQGKMNLNFEQINLSELTEIILEEQQNARSDKNITFHAEITPDIYMLADETLFMRLWINLISNAVRYGKDNGNIWIRLSQSETSVTGSVRDDGIGIEEKHLEKIWNRFYQADPARTSSEDAGAGLGLPMVKWIVSAHKGSICVDSEPGKGSEFTFSFPKTTD